jgi:cobalt-zinc-cadmium efflux system membrane fusion protein
MEKSISLLVLLSFLCLSISACTQKEATETVEQPSKASPGVKKTVTLTPMAIKRFGIAMITVQEKEDRQPLTTTGEIKADENNVFHINSLSNGRVLSDFVQLGDVIKSGQTLAILQNLDVSKVYGDYIHQAHQNEIDTHLEETKMRLAQKNYERIKMLFQEKIAAEKDLLKAEADYQIASQTVAGLKEHATHIREEAKVMLAAYGVKIGPTNSEHIESNSPITAPRSGVIIKKNITIGDVVTNSEPLYVVGDLNQVWLDIAVYDQQLQNIKIGDPVLFSSESLPGQSIKGVINYIKPSTEDNTGTFIARAVLINRHGALKPGMLGKVQIQQEHSTKKLFVPENAVQKYHNETFVFTASTPGEYKKQVVELGDHVDGGYFIASGLKAGNEIVGNGSFTLKAEMLKDLTAGDE